MSILGVLIVLVVIAFGVIAWLVGIYNGLVRLRNEVKNAWAQVDVQLKRRYDLIPNLIETVKGYAKHERETFEKITQARSAAMSAQGVAEQAKAETQLNQALGGLRLVVEAYPDLKANTNFQQLQAELTDIENKLAAARRFFNNAVGEYNTAREQFPAVMFAGMFGFGPRVFFDVGEDSRASMDAAPPQVKFN